MANTGVGDGRVSTAHDEKHPRIHFCYWISLLFDISSSYVTCHTYVIFFICHLSSDCLDSNGSFGCSCVFGKCRIKTSTAAILCKMPSADLKALPPNPWPLQRPLSWKLKALVEMIGARTCCLNTVYVTENIKNVRRALLPNIMKSKSDWNEPKVKKECSRKNNGQGVNGLNAWNIFVSSHFAGQAHFFNTPNALIRTLEPNDKIE